MQSKLIKNFKNFIFREKLFSGGEKLVVAVSGGADSVCLLKLLLAVKEKFDLELRLVHINYGLRGEDSEVDEEFVRELARKENLKLEVVRYVESRKSKVESRFFEVNFSPKKGEGVEKVNEKVNNPAFAGRFTNLEERLRDFRYDVFENIRIEKGCGWIVVAHHQDDQAETFLMNLFRGAGVEGLKGMEVRDEQRKILRPLLNFSKQEIVKFLQETNQRWREDQSNQDNTFLRNRIRNELIPEIEKNYSVKFKERIASTTRQLQEYQKIVQKNVAKAYKQTVSRETTEKIILDSKKYEELSLEIKPLVFREIIKKLKGDLKNITDANYREFQKITQSTKGKKQVMNLANIRIENNRKEILFTKISK